MRKLVLVLVLCLTASWAFAGHVDTYGIGSRATAMGGAMTAATDGPFAVYYNPAAMTRIKRPTISLGAHFVNPNLKIDNFDADVTTPFGTDSVSGSGIQDTSPWLIVPHFAYVQPINDKMAFGVGFYVPYGLSLDWDNNPATNPAAYNASRSWYTREVVTPSIAYKATDKLSIGFGVSLGKTKAGVNRIKYMPTYYMSPAAMSAVYGASGPAIAAVNSDLSGTEIKTDLEDNFNYSFNFGILYEFSDSFSAGATFRSKSDTHLTGTTKTLKTMTYWQNTDVNASTDIDTPNQLQLGIEYKPVKNWIISVDVTRTWWSSIKDYTVSFDEPFMVSAVNPTGTDEEYFDRKWKDTWTYRVGTEYKINDMFTVRGGYYYDPSVVPNSTFDVPWPDSDKHVFSAGLGLNFGRVTIDTVVQYIHIDKVKVSTGESDNLNDTFSSTTYTGEASATASGNLWGYGITVSYAF